MKLLACLAVLLPCALAGPTLDLTLARHLQTDVDLNRPLEHTFAAFKNVHKKHYEDDREEEMRKEIFKVNIDTIVEHNKQYAKREKSYYLGVNQFTDLTHLEFLKLYTGHILAARKPSNATTYLSPANVLLPDQVDWRTKGYVTPVKNQEQCGSCWSFSTTGSLEGQHFKKTGKLLSLSEQQLVDCSGPEGNQGCNGGLMDQAFQYIIDAGGIESEKAYPYDGKDEKCQFDEKLEVATVSGFTDVTSGSEDELQNAVGTQGPVSIAIDASHKSFQLYAGGVYVEPECSSTELDHGVLIVGYGTESMDDYWLVKNSWGTTWGDEGYIKMARNKDNQCGVASQASYPLV